MTINELLSLTGLTAGDEIPAWDAEGQSNGRTKKITAENLAASIKTIASLIASSDLDATPTEDSTNAVQSGGVFDAIAQSTAITDVSSSITASSTYVDTTATVEKRAYRQANVTSFHFTFKAASASASGQPIFTGLPRAYGAAFQFLAFNVTTLKTLFMAVSTSGNVTWYSNNGFSAGDTIRGSVTYICQ